MEKRGLRGRPGSSKTSSERATGDDSKTPKRSSKTKPTKPDGKAGLWKNALLRKRSGDLVSCRANAATILRHAWPDALAFNEFTGEILKSRRWIGAKEDRPADDLMKRGTWTDDDTTAVTTWLERRHEMYPEPTVVRDAVRLEARRNAFHPIRDYLKGITWDGKRRLDTWLIRHAYVADTPYARAVSSKWVLSAVARVFEPGCQVDHVLILEGKGRSGKTSLLRVFTGNADWFASTDAELGGKDVLQMFAAKWIVELGELESLNRTAWERVKHFITNLVDHYRPAYGREVVKQPRNVVLIATTNKFVGYLREADQRFWPLCSKADVFRRVDLDGLRADRDQLWAEAVTRYEAGEPWHLTDPDIIRQAILEQEARRVGDPWEARVHRYVNQSNRREGGVTTLEILDSLGLEAKSVDRGTEMRVAGILHAMGWMQTRTRKNGARVRRYFPSDSGEL